MERRGKILWLALFLLMVAALVMVGSYMLEIVVGYPVGAALSLLGACFWVNAE